MRHFSASAFLCLLLSCIWVCGAIEEQCDSDIASLLHRTQDRGMRSLSTSRPFSVETVTIGEPENTVGLKVLHNTDTGERADIAWTVGGKVDTLRLRSPVTGEVRDLLLSSKRNATRLLTMWWGVNGFLTPFANRIENGTYTLDGTTYHMARNDQELTVNNSNHGFLQGKAMHVVSESQTKDHASVTLAYEFNNASNSDSIIEGYPFRLYFELTYTLDRQGFSVTAKAKNNVETGGPLPFYMGMHPYFKVTDTSKSYLLLDSCTAWNQIQVDENLIPTGSTVPFHGFSDTPIGGSLSKPTLWDTGFKATASSTDCKVLQTEVFDPSFGDSSVLWMTSPEFKWLQVYTGSTPVLGEVIAVEPMSGETDAYNNGQATELLLQAGETWTGTFGFKIKKPPAGLVDAAM